MVGTGLVVERVESDADGEEGEDIGGPAGGGWGVCTYLVVDVEVVEVVFLKRLEMTVRKDMLMGDVIVVLVWVWSGSGLVWSGRRLGKEEDLTNGPPSSTPAGRPAPYPPLERS
jgi:hypothetical protein